MGWPSVSLSYMDIVVKPKTLGVQGKELAISPESGIIEGYESRIAEEGLFVEPSRFFLSSLF